MPDIPFVQDPDIEKFDQLFRIQDRKTAMQEKAKRLMVGDSPSGQFLDGKWVEFIDPDKERLQRISEQQKPGQHGI